MLYAVAYNWGFIQLDLQLCSFLSDNCVSSYLSTSVTPHYVTPPSSTCSVKSCCHNSLNSQYTAEWVTVFASLCHLCRQTGRGWEWHLHHAGEEGKSMWAIVFLMCHTKYERLYGCRFTFYKLLFCWGFLNSTFPFVMIERSVSALIRLQ